jgi:hypothetical protein
MPHELADTGRQPPTFYRRLAEPGGRPGGRRRSFGSWLRRRFVIFVPTTPNLTTGFLITVPKRSVKVLDIPVEDGVKMVMSGGLLVPPSLLGPAAEGPQLPATGDEP